ncbi:MAG: type II toxin-antitoxin system PemK/MazF family toxin [Pyrinomonadaceae bacterium]
MNRGDVWLVEFNDSVGQEIQKTRPAVIVSNDEANKFLRRHQVVPLTSSAKTLYPGESYISFREITGKALISQVTTVSRLRMLKRLGRLTTTEMKNIDRGLLTQLGLTNK